MKRLDILCAVTVEACNAVRTASLVTIDAFNAARDACSIGLSVYNKAIGVEDAPGCAIGVLPERNNASPCALREARSARDFVPALLVAC